jgi:hypothetical protein
MKMKVIFIFCLAFFCWSCDLDDTNLPPSDFVVSAESITKNFAQLIWTQSIDPDGDSINYEVRLQGISLANNLPGDRYELLNLNSDTDYTAEVIAVDTKGNETLASTTFRTHGPNEIILQKEIGYSGDLRAADFVKKKAGGFYALGTLDDKGILFSLDEKGEVAWTWRGNSPAMSVVETSDGGALVILSGKFIKLAASGAVLQELLSNTSINSQVVPAHDGGFLVNTLSYSPYDYPNYGGYTILKKIDETLATQWERKYDDKFRGIVPLIKGGYTLLRWPQFYQKPDYSFSMIDNAGSIVNTVNIGNSDTENLYALSETSDRGFLLGGAFSWGKYDHAFLIRTDVFGEKIWEKEFFGGKHDQIISVIQLDNRDIIILKLEATENLNTGVYKGWKLHTIRTDKSGNITFQIASPTNISYTPAGAKVIRTEKGYCVFTAAGGNFVITEFSNSAFGLALRWKVRKIVRLIFYLDAAPDTAVNITVVS